MKFLVILGLSLFLILISMSVKSSYAVEFTDHTGHVPSWATNVGDNQAGSMCLNVSYDTADGNWCSEFSGYRLDEMLGKNKKTQVNEKY